jgi:hypothetical protein
MSRDRHYAWLTALSFLAHSPLLAPGLAEGLPQPPEEPPNIDTSGRAPSLRRHPIRDSVRIAKEKNRPHPIPNRRPAKHVNVPSDSSSNLPISPTGFTFPRSVSTGVMGMPGTMAGHGSDDIPVNDSAEAPTIPRFSHGRKRSLTGPSSRLPPSALQRLAYTQVPTPTFPSAGSSEYSGSGYGGSSGLIASARTSEASSSTRRNFFEAVGTMRMEAFIEGREEEGSVASSAGLGGFGIRRGGRRRNSGWSGSNMSGSDTRRSGGVYPDDFDAFDPFKGF